MRKCIDKELFVILVLIVGLIAIAASGCSILHKPIKEEVVVRYVDSIKWHDSTVTTYLTKEKVIEYTKPLDTLRMETTYAKAEAYLDTTFQALKGILENKDNIPVKTQIKWKEKVVYKDSIVTKEIPVPTPYEVVRYPKTYWWFMGISLAALAFIGIKVYKRFIL